MSDAETQQSTLPDPTAEGENIQHTVPERAEVATMAAVGGAQENLGPPPRRGPGRPPKASAPPAMSPGEATAKRILAEAEARDTGLKADKPLPPEELKEDWQEALVAKSAKPDAEPELAGLYRVIHGELHFGNVNGEPKIAMLGTKIKLTAEDAKMFLERRCVKWLAAV